jgi:cytochrome b561
LHWLSALLVAAIFGAILYREGLDDGDQRKFWLDIHRSAGLVILALVLFRAGARLRLGREPVVKTTPLLHRLSTLGQLFLYLAMIALPLLGWAQSSARARHFKLFDVPMPSLLSHNPDQADMLGEAHEVIAWAFLALIGLHFLAALYHHFWRKDGVLRSILPGK